MKINGVPYRTIWLADDGETVEILDQTRLPHRLATARLARTEDAAIAIRQMLVRGAPLIAATAAYGLALAMRDNPGDARLSEAAATLRDIRPTAINPARALARMTGALRPLAPNARAETAYRLAAEICNEDVTANSAIGDHGLALIARIAARRGGDPVRILTHGAAGWLSTVDWGAALAPVYKAHQAGTPLEVLVCESRPRNQGAFLTAWELGNSGIAHKVIVDAAAGRMMQSGAVDMAIIGAERITATGDLAAEIGAYPLALAARDTKTPLHVAAPSGSIDFAISDGLLEIPIEQRPGDEVAFVSGRGRDGGIGAVHLLPAGSQAINPAFDVTPARLLSGYVTERGICNASRAALAAMFPERIEEAG